jgi:5-methylcytosine-specific restriction protein B
MAYTPNDRFNELIDFLKSGQINISQRTDATSEHKAFIKAFPAASLAKISANQYCVGKKTNDTFCWWLEVGLRKVMGRFKVGNASQNILYFKKDGSLYKSRHLADLTDLLALRYTLKIQSAIANAKPSEGLLWIDDDDQIYERANVEPRVTIGPGRKLRLLSCYHSNNIIPITSINHIGDFLKVFGLSDNEIPKDKAPVARMLRLMKIYKSAKKQVPDLSTFGFMAALYDHRLGIEPNVIEEDAELDDGIMEDDEFERREGLNTILYGPPGTGKTHNTINEALRVLEPALIENADTTREDLLSAFNRYKAAGQIVFCTFHQSFSYEDFVEGLRASTVNGVINYAVEAGIFKSLCERARQGTTVSEDPFSDALGKLKKTCEEAEDRLVLETKTGKKFEIEYEGGATFKLYPESTKNKNSNYVANIDHVRKLYFTADKSNTYNASYVEGLLSFLKKKCGLTDLPNLEESDNQQRKYVLIIDEINRGNISKIFGDLISLIEPTKRAGQPEALSVMLPYSKEEFSVPSNVYLIGTMNTADRSLAGLDIALRRRFTFTEMPPQYDELSQKTVLDINIGQLLQVMNERIEVLLDRDHCLGHAYFIGLKNEDTLANMSSIFKLQILPLLQEYFFEDWERIAWILNDQNKLDDHAFITKTSFIAKSLFGTKGPDNLQNENKRWRINPDAFSKIESYRQILGVAA